MAPAVQGVPHTRAWLCLYTATGVSSVKKGEGRGRRGLGRAVEVRPDATGLGVCLDDVGGDADGAVWQATIGPCGRALTRMLRHDT